jgi:hypothetical protein
MEYEVIDLSTGQKRKFKLDTTVTAEDIEKKVDAL